MCRGFRCDDGDAIRPRPTRSNFPVLSVVIAARDAEESLPAQLDALLLQDRPGLEWEIVVVDNGSRDRTPKIVTDVSLRNPLVRLVRATQADGAGYARNVGVAAARGDRIAFCDADDVVAGGWVDAMAEALDDHDFVTGPLEIERLNPPWLVESRGRAESDAMSYFEGDLFPFASSCNLGVTKAAFDDVGGFDADFAVGQDIELSLRLWTAGVTLTFDPRIVVHYRYRATLRGTFTRARRYGRVRPVLAERLRSLGRPAPRRLRGARNWGWLVRHLPMLRSQAGRARWLWVAGQRVGNLEGGLRLHRLYL